MKTYPKVNVTPDQAAAIRLLLLDGHTTSNVATSYGKSAAWVWHVAQQNGLTYDKANKRWNCSEQEQETTNVTDGTWNMTTEDYEALLTPEREQTNGNGHTETIDENDPANYYTVEEAAAILGLSTRQTTRYSDRMRTRQLGRRYMFLKSDVEAFAHEQKSLKINPFAAAANDEPAIEQYSGIEEDIQAARELLQRAAKLRTDDLAEKERLALEVNRLETRVAQLETENNRLMGNLKTEISRGLLRQDMDNLRKVL